MSYPYAAYPESLFEWLPPVWAKGNAAIYVTELFRPLADLDLVVADTYAAFVDLRAAAGWRLDALGAMWDEPRGGLDDVEYARIIAGRRIAASVGSGAVTHAGMWAGWRALTGLESGVMVTVAPGAGYLVAMVPFAPSRAFVSRASPIFAAMLPAFRVAAAIVAAPGSLILGETPLGSGVLATAIQ